MALPSRQAFIMRLLEMYRDRTPYLWGARGFQHWTPKGPRDNPLDMDGRPTFAVDCSGAVLATLFAIGGPDKRFTMNSDALSMVCPPPQEVLPGDLAFYAKRGKMVHDMDHVMVVLARVGSECLVIGACGGGSGTTTLAQAGKQDARVKVVGGHKYRADFIRFGSMSKFLT